jgi:FimV-like protein
LAVPPLDLEDLFVTRKPFRFWLIPLLLGPVCALALDIGEIQVHSALNQLFDARIPLPKLTPEELSKVSVKLAPSPMFKEFGLERAPALMNMVFSIEYNAEGQVYVKVVSTKPIQEPSLGLLLEFGWPRGKTFREFTVFLDPVQRLAQRPSDRSKTVLETPTAAAPAPPAEPASVAVAAAPAPPAEPAPPVESAPVAVAAAPAPPAEPAPVAVAATPELERSVPINSGDSPKSEPVAATVMTKAVGVSDPSPLPVEASPPSVRVYRPGDTYGPVAVGEGLWGIALKVRPDPGISRDQMTRALFQANPHAFGKAGIGGLKTGAVLRIPSFQEIADITGSATARHLAEMEGSAAVATAPSPAPVATESSVSKAAAGTPEVFPLEPPVPLEPIAVVTLPPPPTPEATQPGSAPASESAAVKPEPTPAGSEAAAAAPEPPVAPVSEPAVVAAAPEPEVSEPAAQPVDALAEPVQVVLEPVSVTPLLFLAISEMMAAVVQPPAATIATPATPEPPAVDVMAPEPDRDATAPATVPSESVAESAVERAAVSSTRPVETPTLESPVTPMDTASLLAVAENHSLRLDRDSLLQTYLASDISVPLVATFAGSLPAPALPATAVEPSSTVEPPAAAPWSDRAVESPADAVTSDRVDGSEVSVPVVPDQLQKVAAGPAEPPAKVAEQPTWRGYKGGDSYGPIASNERLWDIAAKVRPDPAISKEHMLKALFKANPQAFSKPNNMDSLKVGATLRIPTLQEIVDYTGSKAANQLLEQQRTAETPPASEPAPAAPEPVAPPVPAETPPVSEPAPPAPTEAPPASEPLAPAEAPPASEPAPPAPVAEVPPASEPVGPPAPPAETPPISESAPPAPAAEAPPASEPVGPPAPAEASPASEPLAPAETPPSSEPAPPAPVAEAPPASEPVGPPALPAETLPASESVGPPAPAEAPPALEPVGPPAPPAEALPALEPVGPPAPAEAPPASEPAPAVPEPASEPAPPAPAAEALPAPAETPPVR